MNQWPEKQRISEAGPIFNHYSQIEKKHIHLIDLKANVSKQDYARINKIKIHNRQASKNPET